MNRICKVILAAAAVTALAAPAMAASGDVKLKVRNDGNTADAVSVDNNGMVLGAKLGMGTTTPKAPFHLNLPSALGVLPDPGSAMWSAAMGSILSTQSNSVGSVMAVSDDTATAGYSSSMTAIRTRGTLAVPTAPSSGDSIFGLNGAVYTGQRMWNGAAVAMITDGTVSDGGTPATANSPIRITFSTRPVGWTWYERLTVKSGGNIGISTTDPKTRLHVTGLPVYTSNATAKAALDGAVPGSSVGAFYTDGVGNVKIVY